VEPQLVAVLLIVIARWEREPRQRIAVEGTVPMHTRPAFSGADLEEANQMLPNRFAQVEM